MRTVTFSSILIFAWNAVNVAHSQNATKTSTAWTEHYRRSTVCFGRVLAINGQQTFDPIGAGVLVSPDGAHVVLITARHVFDEPEQKWHPSELRVRFSIEEKKSFSEDLGLPISLTDSKGNNLWTALADGSDIAAIVMQATPTSKALVTDVIGFGDFAASDEDVFDGATVFIFGYPGFSRSLMGNNVLTRAITRSGTIAWTDPSDPLDKPFLVDSNILPGNSGGPVFKVPTGISRSGAMVVGNRTALVGIVTSDLRGFYAVEADGRIVLQKWNDLPNPSVEGVSVIGIGGLGKVEPASKIKKLATIALSSVH